MIIQLLVLAAGAAFAAPSDKVIHTPTEMTLAVMLADVRRKRVMETQEAVMGGAEELRDAVASGSGAARKQLAARLPGVSEEPFDLCRAGCAEAPVSLHIEDSSLADDAFLSLARPWLKLQEARGKKVKMTVDPGVGVQLTLEDFPRWPVVTLAVTPTPTGGFDVAVENGPEAALIYAAESAVLTAAN